MTKKGRSITARLAKLTIGIVCLSFLLLIRDRTSSSARLVSIQELPEIGEMCPPEPPDSSSGASADLQDDNLFSAFRETSVLAAGQNASDATEMTRSPVRNILDKDPIYASVGVDMRF